MFYVATNIPNVNVCAYVDVALELVVINITNSMYACMLCYVMLCYAMSCHAMLCYVM